MWSVLPLLRARGRDVQYFLWSSKQKKDRGTAQQWLKEVSDSATYLITTLHFDRWRSSADLDRKMSRFAFV
jgi:hypothetical protein